jgi:tRNA (adenine-N(1)-)-methyltransferase non-catalytic subunit
MTARNPDVATPNDYCIIKMPSGNSKVVQLKPGEEIQLGKFGHFHADDLLGKYYGVSYEIYDRNKIKRVENPDFLEDFDIDPTEETEANNQNLLDGSSVQKLSQVEIEDLKKKSLSGEFSHKELIEQIVSNNENFNEKTEFSKAKYIKRKFKKFSKIFIPIRSTAKAFAEYYMEKGNEKIKELRMDTLSQLLTYANVRAGSKLLVCDDTSGLVGAAILERTRGIGQVYFIHDGQASNLEIVKYCNFPEEVLGSVVTYPWWRLHMPFEKVHSETAESIQRAEERYQRYMKEKEGLESGGFDALIIASKFNPKQIIDKLSQYVAHSGAIVCYEYRKEVHLN